MRFLQLIAVKLIAGAFFLVIALFSRPLLSHSLIIHGSYQDQLTKFDRKTGGLSKHNSYFSNRVGAGGFLNASRGDALFLKECQLEYQVSMDGCLFREERDLD